MLKMMTCPNQKAFFRFNAILRIIENFNFRKFIHCADVITSFIIHGFLWWENYSWFPDSSFSSMFCGYHSDEIWVGIGSLLKYDSLP